MAENFDRTLTDIEGTVTDAQTRTDTDVTMTDATLADAKQRRASAPAGTPDKESFDKGSLLLDTYEVLSAPIQGGMGVVYRVHHSSWNVDLAVKRPKESYFQSDKQKENFIKECERWINLGLHPNIVSCYYVRELNSIPSVFSEWMDGGSLSDQIRSGKLYEGTEQDVEERLLDVAIQFARGLQYSHRNGLIHQDVKPGNLLLTIDGEAKVTDFGIAGGGAGENANTWSGAYTREYASAEQQSKGMFTPKTDIYSWAVSVLMMYCGKRLWQNGIDAGLEFDKHIKQTRVPLSDVLTALLRACLEQNIDARPESFDEVLTVLLGVYKAQTGKAYPREEPKAAADTADSLNNRALSMLDLGKPKEAEKLWIKARQTEADHAASTANQQLWLWRDAQIDEASATQELSILYQKTRNLDAAKMLLMLYLELGMNDEAKEFAEDTLVSTLVQKKLDWSRAISQKSSYCLEIPNNPEYDLESAVLLSDNTVLIADGSFWLRQYDPQNCTQIDEFSTQALLGIRCDRLLADYFHGGYYAYAHRFDHQTIAGTPSIPLSRIVGHTVAMKFAVTGQPVRFHIENNTVLTADPTKSTLCRLWLSRDGNNLFALINHQYFCSYNDTDWSDMFIHVWDTNTGELLSASLTEVPYDPWADYDVVPDGCDFFLRQSRATYRAFHKKSKRCIRTVPVFTRNATSRAYEQGKCCFSADGRYLLIPQTFSSRDVALYVLPHNTPSAQFILSRITTVDVASEYEKQRLSIKKAFDSAYIQKHFSDAINLFEKYRAIPGSENTVDAIQMERDISRYCIRIGIHHTTEETASDWKPAHAMYSQLSTNTSIYRQVESFFSKHTCRWEVEFEELDGTKHREWLHKRKYDTYFLSSDERYVLFHYGPVTPHLTINDDAFIGRLDMRTKTVQLLGLASEISPNDQRAAYLCNNEVVIRDIVNQARFTVKTNIDVFPERVYFTHDSQFVYCVGHANQIAMLLLISIQLNGRIYPVKIPFAPSKSLTFSNDGFFLVDEYQNKSVRLSYTYAFPGWADWDNGALPFIDVFVSKHPKMYLRSDFLSLMDELALRGYGWLMPDGVEARINKLGSKEGNSQKQPSADSGQKHRGFFGRTR